MFQDLVERAKRHGENIKTKSDRKKEVKLLLRDVVKEAIPELEQLGFYKVHYHELCDSFTLRLQVRRSYSESSFTHNMELNSIKSCINYGSGANSAKGKEFAFNYDMNDSQLVGIMKHALRALVAGALHSLEEGKVRGMA